MTAKQVQTLNPEYGMPIVSDFSEVPEERPRMPGDDEMYQAYAIVSAFNAIEKQYRDVDGVFCGLEAILFYDSSDPNRYVVPDCIVAFDVDARRIYEIRRYYTWQVGKPPDVVFEMVSPSTRRRDQEDKRLIYAEMSVPEYWRFDAHGDVITPRLQGDILQDGKYAPAETGVNADGLLYGYSPTLGARVCAEGQHVKLQDPLTGEYVLTPIEERDRRVEAEAARDRAEVAAQAERAAREHAEATAQAERAAREHAEATAQAERAARDRAEQRLRELEDRLGEPE